jgi:hypothetical protein
MGQVRKVKDIQWLMGCLVALSRFVSQLGERGLPLYKLLKSLTLSIGLGEIIGNRLTTGRIAKWVLELMRLLSMTYASPRSSGSSGFTSILTSGSL